MKANVGSKKDLESLQNRLITNFLSEHVKQYLDRALYDYNLDKIQAGTDLDKIKLEIPSLSSNIIEGFGVCVMADVSGYSKLTSIMSERGQHGIELLTKTMKQYLDKIIDIIIRHGGDIVKLAGDAVLFYWKLNVGSKALKMALQANCTIDSDTTSPCNCIDCLQGDTVLKAALCCSDLLKQLGKFEVNIEGCDVKYLSIHLGIGAGEVYDVHARGSDDRFEHFVAGDAVCQLMAVLNDAKPAQLALSNTAWYYLTKITETSKFVIKERNMNCIIVEGLENVKIKKRPTTQVFNDVNMLAKILPFEYRKVLYEKYIAKPVMYKLKGGFDNFMSLTDIRQVTTLFIKFGSPRIIEKNYLNKIVESFAFVNSIVERLEGTIRQLNVDDKGAVLLAFFGLPPLSHQNDAIYGTKAALEISKILIGQDFSIGVTTGIVAVGGVGNTTRTKYALMGDSINMAARLMCLPEANENILVDGRTYKLCESTVITFDQGRYVKVKGKQEKIEVFSPIKLQEKATIGDFKTKKGSLLVGEEICQKRQTLIGRERESELIKSALERHLLSSPASLVIEGDTGSGLNTLIHFLKEEAADSGFITFSTSASEININSPMYAFRDLIYDLIALTHNAGLSGLHEEKLFKEPKKTISKSDFGVSPIDGGHFISVNEETLQHKKLEAEAIAILNSFGTFERTVSKRIRSQLRNTSSSKNRTNDFILNKPKDLTSTDHLSKISLRKLHTVSSLVCSQQKMLSKSSKKSGLLQSSQISSHGGSIDKFDEDIAFSSVRNKSFNHITRNHIAAINNYEYKVKESYDDSIENRIMNMLAGMGENVSLAPLFRYIFPSEFSDIFSDCYGCQSSSNMRELFDLIQRIFGCISSKSAVLIVIEEAQWLDHSSWQLVGEIFSVCKDVMIVICVRNMKQYILGDDIHIFERIKSNPRTTYFKVGNMSKGHLENLLIHSLKAYQKDPDFISMLPELPLSISADIIDLVYKRSGGSPLYAKSIIRSIIENDLAISKGDHLVFKDSVNRDAIVFPGEDLQSLIMSQFDKLDPDFQQFLKAASVIGEHFLVDDVKLLLPISLHSVILNESFFRKDKYEFLAKEEDPSGVMYYFRSDIIRKGIYSLMHQEQRQELHLKLAHYYEMILNNNNETRMLASVFYNYKNSGNFEKELFYLEKLCHFYYELGFPDEAIRHYLNLIESYKLKKITLKEKFLLASWYYELGELFESKKEFQNASEYIIQAIKLLGYSYPLTKFDLKLRSYLYFLVYKTKIDCFLFSTMDELTIEMLRNCIRFLAELLLASENIDGYRFCILSGTIISRLKIADPVGLMFESKAALEFHSDRLDFVISKLTDCENATHSSSDPDVNICAEISVILIRAQLHRGYYSSAWKKSFALLKYAELSKNITLLSESAMLKILLETLLNKVNDQTGSVDFASYIRIIELKDSSVVSFGSSILAFFISLSNSKEELYVKVCLNITTEANFAEKLLESMVRMMCSNHDYKSFHSSRKFLHEIALVCLLTWFYEIGPANKNFSKSQTSFNFIQVLTQWKIYMNDIKSHHWFIVLCPFLRIGHCIFKILGFFITNTSALERFKKDLLYYTSFANFLACLKSFLAEAQISIKRNFKSFHLGKVLVMFFKNLEMECGELINFQNATKGQHNNVQSRKGKKYWIKMESNKDVLQIPFLHQLLDET